MKPCFSIYNCPHCERKIYCDTYQSLHRYLTPDKTTYELKIARPELVNQIKGV